MLPKTRRKIKVKKKKPVVDSRVQDLDFVGIREGFITAVRERGFNERGERIVLSPWYIELLRAIADFRITETYVTGVAQLGKTLAHTNLLLYVTEELRLNALWSYDLQASLNIQVPSNFRPVASHWLHTAGKSNSAGTKNNTIYQIGEATIQFTYVSTGNSQRGGAAAGGVAVGVSRDILFKEERSQYPFGADAPLNRRLDASRIPTKPIREFGTPGSGGGIEVNINNADHHFYPHFRCSSCGSVSPLHPMGSLLLESTITIFSGNVASYLSSSGRPRKWFHHDPDNAIATAYFGCPHCKEEIVDRDFWYQCLKTNITLTDYLADIPKRLNKIGLSISPLLRTSPFAASEIISEGLTTTNPLDWQQQMLGIPSTALENSISLEMIEPLIGFKSELRCDFTLAGIDCGRGGHWLTLIDYYLPDNYCDRSCVEVLESAIRHITYAGIIDKNSLPTAISRCQYGIVDNEPDRDWATRLCRSSVLEMADQKPGLKAAVARTSVLDGGIASPCWDIRNEKFLGYVLNGFLLGTYRFDESFRQYLGNLSSDRNPFRHIMSMKLDPITQRWVRPVDHVDDIFYALMFNEVAFYIQLMKLKSSRGIGTWKF